MLSDTKSSGINNGGRRRVILWLSAATVVLGVAGVFAVPADFELASWFRADKLPGDLRRIVTLSEAFAHGSGAAFILIAIWLSVSPARRGAVGIAICITLTSGLAANALKAGFVRVRPHSVGKILIEESPWFAQASTSETLIDGPKPKGPQPEGPEPEGPEPEGPEPEGPEPEGPEPERVEPDFGDSRQRSFPSGHSATAWGLAIGLSLAFPRSALVFLLLAILACVQRISSGAHFPSDVFAGAVIACLCAIAILLVSGRVGQRKLDG